MTPLHWAAYQSDEIMVSLLLANGARQTMTKLGDTPVDMAGFCDEENTVDVFLTDFENRFRGVEPPSMIVDEENAAGRTPTNNQVHPNMVHADLPNDPILEND